MYREKVLTWNVKSSFIAVPRPQNTSETWFSLGRTCLKLDLGDAIKFKVDCWLTDGTLRGFGLWSRLLACAWTLSWHPSQNAVESKPDPWSPKQDKHSKEASLPQIMHCRGAEKYRTRAKSMTFRLRWISKKILFHRYLLKNIPDLRYANFRAPYDRFPGSLRPIFRL